MMNNVVPMFSPTDEETPYEQGEKKSSLQTVNHDREGIYTLLDSSCQHLSCGPVDRGINI